MRFLIPLLFLLTSIGVDAQQYSFRQYSLKEGLVQSQVRSIHLDSNGFLWFGTLGGVSKFNGSNFENYTKYQGLIDNQINVIKELRDHRLIFGSTTGISIQSKVDHSFENFKFENNTDDFFINDLFELEGGKILVCTYQGVFTFYKGEFSKVDIPQKSGHAHKIFRASDGMIKIAFGNCVYNYENGEVSKYFQLENTESFIYDILEDSRGNLVLGTRRDGIVFLKNGIQIEKINRDNGLISNKITSLFTDSKDRIWAGGRQGISVIKEDYIINLNNSKGLLYDDIKALGEDLNGNIWIGTDANGILKFTTEQILNYTTESGLSSNLVMSISKDNEERVWVGTYDAGLNVIHDNQITQVVNPDIPNALRIWNSKKIGNEIWIASDLGLYRIFEDLSVVHYDDEDGLISKRQKCIFQDQEGNVWLGSDQGVNLYKNDSIFDFNFPEELNITKVREIKQDQNSTYWFATKQGVISFDASSSSGFQIYSGIEDPSIYDIEIDHNNTVWAATGSGLYKLTNNELILIEIDKIPLSNHVNFVESVDDLLILGTNNGLYTTDLNQIDANGNYSFFPFTFTYEVVGSETNQNAIFVDELHNLWYGTTSGLIKVENLKELVRKNQEPPRVVINEIRLNLEEVNWKTKADSINLKTGLPENLVVDYTNNHFTFDFIGINYQDPKNVIYQYMLEGFDKDWQPITKEKIATYNNLDYTDYTFLLKGKIKNSPWSDVSKFSFSITPPFWRTWWFYILTAIVLIGILVYAFHRRKQILLTEHEKEKFEFQSKLLALEQQTLNSSMNRHFIFNSLNSIQYYINRKDRLAANKYLSSFAKLIRKNLDSSQHNTTNLKEELDRLGLYIELEQMRFQDKFNFNLVIDEGIDTENVEVPSMLLQPFLENSIWHGLLPKEEKGNLNLHILRHNRDDIEIEIIDDGIGIQTSMDNKVGNLSHDSRGMEITKGRIDLIKKNSDSTMELIGPQEIKNKEGVTIGTQVRIIIPQNIKEIFNQ